MTRTAQSNLLKELIRELDYDLYKSMFVEAHIEDPEENQERIDNLLAIISFHDA